jgi:ribosomal RNA-processing protein 8
MSLFPSAFDTGLPSTSSSKPLTLGGGGAGGKRKRPSMTNTAGKDEQLRATQVNLAKLMDRVDRGDFTDKDRSGREAMGHMGKKKAKKSHDAPAPAPPTGNKGKKAENKGPKPAAKVEPSPKVEKKKKGKPPAETPPSTKAPKNKGKGKLAPVELDLELPTPKADPSDGLTDMQRKMQTKLEGARFRWINEQLYSTSSDEAVAMMDKDPKVFADVSCTSEK